MIPNRWSGSLSLFAENFNPNTIGYSAGQNITRSAYNGEVLYNGIGLGEAFATIGNFIWVREEGTLRKVDAYTGEDTGVTITISEPDAKIIYFHKNVAYFATCDSTGPLIAVDLNPGVETVKWSRSGIQIGVWYRVDDHLSISDDDVIYFIQCEGYNAIDLLVLNYDTGETEKVFSEKNYVSGVTAVNEYVYLEGGNAVSKYTYDKTSKVFSEVFTVDAESPARVLNNGMVLGGDGVFSAEGVKVKNGVGGGCGGSWHYVNNINSTQR